MRPTCSPHGTLNRFARSALAIRALIALAVVSGGAAPASAQGRAKEGLPNPFFAMDTATRDANHQSYEDQAKMIQALGYAGWGPSGTENVPAMLKALDHQKLKMFAIYVGCNIDPDQPKFDPKLKEAIAALKGRETFLWVYVLSNKHKPSTTEGDENAVAVLREIAALAEAGGLRVSLYPHVGFYMARVEDAVRLATKVDRKNVGVTFNLCHWLNLDHGKNMEALIDLAMPHLSIVTINGADREGQNWDRLILPLGEGDFDVYGFLKALKKRGFDGPVGFQGYGIKGDLHAVLKKTMATWREYDRRMAAEGPDRKADAGGVWVSSLDVSKATQGWGKSRADLSIQERPLTIAGRKFERGFGTHATGALYIDLKGAGKRFTALVGVDDEVQGTGTVAFQVIGDSKRLFKSDVMKNGQEARKIDIDITGVKTLGLLSGSGGDGIAFDHADWAEARIEMIGDAKPETIRAPKEEAVVLTPRPGPAPKINGPKVYGCRPGKPFIFRVPTTGRRPMEFAAEGLPDTLRLDAANGIITGAAPPRGEYPVTLRAKNGEGESTRVLKIVAGDTLALTPPMGWNHWYTHYDRITDALMREAADVMVSSGMADVGYQYVNIDDCWMNAPKQTDPLRVGPLRDEKGNILPNKHFPDMRAMTDYIHSKGLKAGLYTSPGPFTCAGFAGTYQHEEQDAKQFADWGFDFLKYDWCSYGEIAKQQTGTDLEKFKKPYKQMGDILKRQDRDIIYNLCQYGMGNVWEWGEEVGGHCWRTAGDLGFELDRIFEVALANAAHRKWSKPGAWNDPDYIQIGLIGSAHNMGRPTPCPLTPNEQYSFMSLWCLSAAPLFYSGLMGQLDEFTINVLCNAEVIEINQDPLGECGRIIPIDEETFVMVKNLEDGSKAVGLCNRGEVERPVTVKWSDLGLNGNQSVRDLWRQKDLGTIKGEFQAAVPRHGTVLVRIGRR